MEHLIGFEGLGISPFSLDTVAFRIGSFSVYWYAVIITCGVMLAVAFGLWQSRKFDLTPDNIVDVLLWGLPIGVVCARLYYVIFTWGQYHSFYDVVNIRNGGLAIYGGIIGGFLTGLVYCRIKKINLFALFDIAALGFMIGQAIGRWGNFVNAEAHGTVTDLPWGMTIDGSGPYHPTFLYESLWNVIGFILLFLFAKKWKKQHGEVFFLYSAWYGAGRFWIEGLRTDSLYLWGGVIRVSQLLAAVFFVFGVVLFVLCRKGVLSKWSAASAQKKKKKEKEAYKPVYMPLLHPENADPALTGGDGEDPKALREGEEEPEQKPEKESDSTEETDHE